MHLPHPSLEKHNTEGVEDVRRFWSDRGLDSIYEDQTFAVTKGRGKRVVISLHKDNNIGLTTLQTQSYYMP